MVPDFIPLISQESHQSVPQPPPGKNLLKGHEVVLSGTVMVEHEDTSPSEPTVLLHRDGDLVTSIEFCCVCGRNATVQLEYGGE